MKAGTVFIPTVVKQKQAKRNKWHQQASHITIRSRLLTHANRQMREEFCGLIRGIYHPLDAAHREPVIKKKTHNIVREYLRLQQT
jgi:hypothetical protein